MVPTTRAERDWRKLPEDAAAAFRRLLQRLASGEHVPQKVLGGVTIEGAKRVWSARANRQFRLLFERDGSTLTLLAFTDRGDKEFYRHE